MIFDNTYCILNSMHTNNMAFVSCKCAVFLLHMLQTHKAVHRLIEANFSLDGGQLQFSSILSGNGLGTLVSVHVVRGCAIRMNRCNESLGDVIKFSYPVFSFSIDSLYSSRSSNQFSFSLYRTVSVPAYILIF